MRRTFTVGLTLVLLACSRDGQAATQPAPKASGQSLFRDAAAGAPTAEAQVPLGTSLAPLIDRLKPAVVNISTTTAVKHPRAQRFQRRMPQGPQGQDPFEDFFERYFGQPAPGGPEGPELRGQSLGSGFVLNRDGFILTNNHVVKDATDIVVRLSDGREFKADVVGRDALTDVALIKLSKPPSDLPTVVLGDSDALQQGDFVLALGSPLGLRDTATLGIVSAKHRAGISPIGTGTYDDYIQTDAAINPGNSGGPLFNLRGEVVGINTAIVRPDIGQGIGFAVPVNLAKSILPQLREKGKVTRGFMGVSVGELTPDLTQAFGLPSGTKGALVQNVVPRGPAAKAGLEAGDLIVALNGKPVDSAGGVTRGVAVVPPGEKVDLTVLRKGEKKSFSFKVAQRPEDEGVAQRGESADEEEGGDKAKTQKLGVSLAPLTAEMARELGASGSEGVVVTNVVEGGPAERAGMRRGDVILEVNRQPVKQPDDVKNAIAKMKQGEMALLRVRRGDQAVYLAVPVGGRQ
ncbi:MAG TPA: DegQ family serine endoprotease [Anaeromyxobacter sp.]|nr:DegQ family serine endoprotease [Anaeromyxobacter sp.]